MSNTTRLEKEPIVKNKHEDERRAHEESDDRRETRKKREWVVIDSMEAGEIGQGQVRSVIRRERIGRRKKE